MTTNTTTETTIEIIEQFSPRSCIQNTDFNPGEEKPAELEKNRDLNPELLVLDIHIKQTQQQSSDEDMVVNPIESQNQDERFDRCLQVIFFTIVFFLFLYVFLEEIEQIIDSIMD